MAQETIQIAEFAVETATSINDLKLNIKALKDTMADLTIGSEEYSEALEELQKNQTALKNAMHATTVDGKEEGKTLEGIAKAANGLGTSYNALVKRMADLTQEFRATEDAARRADLAREIKSINKELKELDARRGIYGRNVGDYFNQIFPSLQKTNDALKLMGKQPVMSLVILLAPVLTKIVDALKENETALGAIKKLMDSLKPVMDFMQGVLEKLAGLLSNAVDWALELGETTGVSFKNIVAGAVGVGNALKEFLLIPIRNVIDGAKAMGQVFQNIFKGNFRQAAQDAKQAVKDIGENFRKGFSFKGNFEAGKEAGEAFAAGLKSSKKKAAEAAAEVKEEVLESLIPSADDIRKAMEKAEARRAEWEKFLEADLKELTGMLNEENKAFTDALQAELDAQLDAEYDTMLKEREIMQQRLQSLDMLAGATSSILGSIADMYEVNADEDEQAAQRAKSLRTASAVIDTISGAIGAYMQTVKTLPAPWNVAAAAANAAAVLAAGYAQIKQINAVRVGSGGASGAPALAQAPAFAPSIPQIRSVTGRSEEERLNRMAGDSRVYLVYSDLEIADTRQRVKVRETEF